MVANQLVKKLCHKPNNELGECIKVTGEIDNHIVRNQDNGSLESSDDHMTAKQAFQPSYPSYLISFYIR